MGICCEYLDYVESAFDEHFSQKGYKREEPVAVSSRVDPTVDFVGSKISPLKHFVIEGNISEQGHYLIQDCFRTKGIKKLKTLEPSRFGSCFRTMGTLTNPDIEKVVFDTFDYLVNEIGINPQDLLIKINIDDADLMAATSSVVGDIRREENAADAHYKHRYGLDEQGIFGRDFNIAVRKRKTDEFASVGTIVFMEQNDNGIGIDMGIGNLSLAMCNFGMDNTLSVSRMADVIDIDDIEAQRLADSLMGLALLQKEHVQDISSHADRASKNFRWKFNKYEDAVVYWKSQFGLSDEQVLEY
ncbi:MAG: hypothetical protein AAB546_04445, partial [Patescibacteria group bacterium]